MGKFAKKNQKELRQEAKRRGRTGRKVTPRESVVEDEELVDPDSADLMYDDVDQYHQKKHEDLEARGFQDEEEDESDREEEIMPVGGDDTDEDDEDDEQERGSDEEGIPSRSAWGNKRSTFYKTDFVDKDHGRFQGSDAEEAEEEEREAREIQARFAAELAEDDFGLGASLPVVEKQTQESHEEAVSDVPEVTVSDLSRLTEYEKLERIKQESPELIDLIADTKKKLSELNSILQPLITALGRTKFLTDRAELYIRTKYQLILGYCQNVAFYMSLKAKRVPVQNHPVTRRLVDFRKLLLKLDPLDKLYKEDMKKAVDVLRSGGDVGTLGKTEKSKPKKKVAFADTTAADQAPQSKKEKSLAQRLSDKEKIPASEEDEDMEDDAADPKRKATYQIVKNKGITPYRKKEFRNPRVKHRMKYRKALISRKGQVREYKPEMKKYGGELSGIRAGVIKSVKFK